MKFFIAFALVAAVAAIPVEIHPYQVIFINEVPSDIFAQIDIGPAIVEHSQLLEDDANAQLLNPNLSKHSPVLVVDFAEAAEPLEAADAVQVIHFAEPIDAAEAVQFVDFAEAVHFVDDAVAVDAVQFVDDAVAVDAVQVVNDAVAVDSVQVIQHAEAIESVQVVEIDENSPSPVEISDAILPEIVKPIVIAPPSLPEVAEPIVNSVSDILY